MIMWLLGGRKESDIINPACHVKKRRKKQKEKEKRRNGT